MKIKRLRLKNDSVPILAIQGRNRWIPLKCLMDPEDKLNGNAIAQGFTDIVSVLKAPQTIRDKWQALADEYNDELPEIDDTPPAPLPATVL